MKEFYEFALIVQKDQCAVSMMDEIDARSVRGSFVVEKVLTSLMNLGESIPAPYQNTSWFGYFGRWNMMRSVWIGCVRTPH